MTATAGAVIGAFKGMFGKAEENTPEQKTAAEQPQISQAVEHGESRQEEPLRSPDTTRTKAHAEGMEPAATRVGAEESRPKEGAVAQR